MIGHALVWAALTAGCAGDGEPTPRLSAEILRELPSKPPRRQLDLRWTITDPGGARWLVVPARVAYPPPQPLVLRSAEHLSGSPGRWRLVGADWWSYEAVPLIDGGPVDGSMWAGEQEPASSAVLANAISLPDGTSLEQLPHGERHHWDPPIVMRLDAPVVVPFTAR